MVENRYQLKANIKSKMYNGVIPSVTANDHIIFEVTLFDDALPMTLNSAYRYTLVTMRKNNTSVIREGTLSGSVILFELGASETTTIGRVEASIQIYDADNKRISSAPIAYDVLKDFSLSGSLPADDKTLVLANESYLKTAAYDAIYEKAETFNYEISGVTSSTAAILHAEKVFDFINLPETFRFNIKANYMSKTSTTTGFQIKVFMGDSPTPGNLTGAIEFILPIINASANISKLYDESSIITKSGKRYAHIFFMSIQSDKSVSPVLFELNDIEMLVDSADVTLPELSDFTGFATTSFSFSKEYFSEKITTENNVKQIFNSNVSNLSGKTWNVIGDSITEVNFRTTKNYHNFIKDWFGCTVNNYGISGTGWFTPSSSGGTNAIHQRVSSLPDADIITVFAGTNDWAEVGKTFSLGALGDIDPNVSFYGAVDNTLTQLINKYPTKVIAVFTPLPRNGSQIETQNSAGVTLKQVTDAIIQVCNRYSIPVLDLYRNSGFFPWNSTNNAAFFSCATSPLGDGLHPNAAGHNRLAYKILEFLNNLLGMYYYEEKATAFISDTFNRSDNASTMGIADTGQTWSVVTGTWGIIGNQAYTSVATSESVTTIDSGKADATVQVKFTIGATNTRLVFRCFNANNLMLVNREASSYAIFKKVNGTYTKIAETTGITPASGDVIRVVTKGPSITCYINGVKAMSAIETANQTATKHGLGNNSSTTVRFDNFSIS